MGMVRVWECGGRGPRGQFAGIFLFIYFIFLFYFFFFNVKQQGAKQQRAEIRNFNFKNSRIFLLSNT